MHFRNCASSPAQPSAPYPDDAQQSVESLAYVRTPGEVFASADPVNQIRTGLSREAEAGMNILSIDDMIVTHGFCSCWFGRRTRRWLMVLRRSGFSRVETLPLGAMVCRQLMRLTWMESVNANGIELRVTASTAVSWRLHEEDARDENPWRLNSAEVDD